jgi:GTPase SAR1 family protein
MYFRDANIALIVFDVSNRKSIDSVEYWANEVKKAQVEDSFIVLVGNKSDLAQKR